MKIRINRKIPSFTVGKSYKVEAVMRTSYMIENDRGFVQSVNKEYCDKVKLFEFLHR